MLKKIIITVAFFLLSAPAIYACRCFMPATVRQAYDTAEVVMSVNVESVADPLPGTFPFGDIGGLHTAVDRVYKGDVSPMGKLFFAQGQGSNCIQAYEKWYIGEKMLVFARKPVSPFTAWQTRICSRSTLLKNAPADQLWLDKMDSVAGKTRISGRAVLSLGSADKGMGIVRVGIKEIRILIEGDDKTYEAVTNKDGVYEIYDLPPGKYIIKPVLREKYDLTRVRRFYDLGPEKDRTQEELKAANALVEIIGPESVELTLKDGQPVHLFPGGHTVVDLYYQENKQTALLAPGILDWAFILKRRVKPFEMSAYRHP